MTDRELLARIAASAGQKAGYKQLVRELSLGGGRERRLLLEHLARLTARGKLIQLDREHWGLPRTNSRQSAAARENLVAGRLDLHRDGYGFVRPNRKPAAARSRPLLRSRTFSSRPTTSTPPCRAIRFGRSRPSQSRWPPAGPHRAHSGAPQPHRGRHVSRRAPGPRPQQRRHSLRRPHDAAHRDSSRRGDPYRRGISHAASRPR